MRYVGDDVMNDWILINYHTGSGTYADELAAAWQAGPVGLHDAERHDVHRALWHLGQRVGRVRAGSCARARCIGACIVYHALSRVLCITHCVSTSIK